MKGMVGMVQAFKNFVQICCTVFSCACSCVYVKYNRSKIERDE